MEDKQVDILHYIRKDKGLLFLVMIGEHCKTVQQADAILEECYQISESDFDQYYKDLKLEVITVGDAKAVNELMNVVHGSDNFDPKA